MKKIKELLKNLDLFKIKIKLQMKLFKIHIDNINSKL